MRLFVCLVFNATFNTFLGSILAVRSSNQRSWVSNKYLPISLGLEVRNKYPSDTMSDIKMSWSLPVLCSLNQRSLDWHSLIANQLNKLGWLTKLCPVVSILHECVVQMEISITEGNCFWRERGCAEFLQCSYLR